MAPYEEFKVFINDFFGLYMPGMTQTEIAKELKTQQSVVSKWYSGERLPSSEIIKRIYDLLGKDIKKEVEKAKEERIRYKMENSGKSTYYDKDTETLYINNDKTKPRLPVKVSAGMVAEYYDGVLESQCERTPIIKQFPSYDFTMIVQGDSMEPKYEGGDEIACKRVEKTIVPGCTYLVDTRDGAYLKRLYPEENRIRCDSYNPLYPSFYLDKEDINGIYRIIGLLRII